MKFYEFDAFTVQFRQIYVITYLKIFAGMQKYMRLNVNTVFNAIFVSVNI